MSYSLATIWYERNRFLPAILAVAFSAMLIVLQTGLLVSLLAMMSVPVDKAQADIWVGYPGVRSVDLGRPIPDRWISRVLAQPEVVRAEPMMIGFALWTRPIREEAPSPPEVCTIVGTRLDSESLGAVEAVRKNRDLLANLSEPGAVVVDRSEFHRLGIRQVGDQAEIFGHRVKVVGVVDGYKSLSGPYVFCSLETARPLLRIRPEDTTYLVARCQSPEQVPGVIEQLQTIPKMQAFSAPDFSMRSRMHWLTTTKAGLALGFTALLGLLVGAVVTSQTLYSATSASQREYATLRAMGIPRWRLKASVLAQSFWVGFAGLLLAIPITWLLTEIAQLLGTQIRLPAMIILAGSVITMAMALLSGLAALRSFSGVDPAHNIR
ncbi:ABC transporter permease [Tuwongella immobilis]|uniref:Uncharacterized protein n=1 Tax=Tuwongella immobilis TaxID=692036 RepID=A0A6C2YVK3_9BACT|nr:ABC transporter permease [Tuwongella immobilis]VIP05778.1 abc transporter permease : ABC-type antimicrobial peptide transport system, permease component OS=Singulisphaera acidiphila (strain ATCC BAA-1392 / DSM 18658 / VKM B-2454 / MOB10) GN=Sinac_2084 PE=4 SV=1: MacB_PCD: FtsX [Tuwongella immobilis]VTS08912.1 abc transporter permease : ABC-type antimicrobial peptide transport system, permease component OS=Singulisphaera acidiphila (strain ATCC BAA-1392 / DSM 18658 / VKM B-2454 / MOB10) GN=Sina